MDDRQKRLLQEMMKFSKSGDQLLSVPINVPSTVGSSGKSNHSNSQNNSTKEKNIGNVNHTPKKSQNQSSSSDIHFSGSAFLSSPDPSTIPAPNFADDDCDNSLPKNISPVAKQIIHSTSSSTNGCSKKKEQAQDNSPKAAEDKTDTLKRFLKVRKSS